MPRQLPWLNNGGGGSSRPPVKNKPKAASKPSIPDDIDDDSFGDTVLGRKDKGEGRANLSSGSEDDVSSGRKKERLPSSSPPPIQYHIQPEIEYMRKGTKYDLRDDEWMMVEDEFLETAKLFTRHLHIAEYEKLKEQIQAKKKEQVEAIRPTVSGAKSSAEGGLKKRAKLQEKRQQKAIRDVFASPDSSEEEAAKIPPRVLHSRRRYLQPTSTRDSDRDNLDAPLRQKRPLVKTSTVANTSSLDRIETGITPSSTSGVPNTTSRTTFVKPAIPASTTQGRLVNPKISRVKPFDMFDDYMPPAKRNSDTPRISASPARAAPVSRSPSDPTTSNKTHPSKFKDDDNWGRKGRESSSSTSKETADRIAKRRAEREKKKEDKKDIKLDDIPTFLF